MDNINIGILCMQGAFIEHKNILEKFSVNVVEVRKVEDFENINGLIIPGGESTTIGKLIKELDLQDKLINLIKRGMPVWGTCAGLILLAKEIKNSHNVYLGIMNITAVRNSYGRQLASFSYNGKIKGIDGVFPMVFIRAPHIESVEDSVSILAKVDNKIVAARENNLLVTAFHPELTEDFRVHKYFIDMVKENIIK